MTDRTFIYFIQPEGGGLIKIGRADDPERRLRELQCGSPVKLRLCGFHEATCDMENRLHFLFGEYREHGEWFRPCPQLAEIAGAIPDPTIEECPIDGTRRGTADWQWKVEYLHNRDLIPPPRHIEPFERPPQKPVTALPDDVDPSWHWRPRDDYPEAA